MGLGEILDQEDHETDRIVELESSDSEDDERQKYYSRARSLIRRKAKANSSSRLPSGLRNRNRNRRSIAAADYSFASIFIEDVRDANEEEAVNSFRQALLAKNLLPTSHDDYHTMLR